MGDPLSTLLFLLGVGFLCANVLAVADYLQHVRRRAQSVLTWLPPPGPYPWLPVVMMRISSGE